MLSRCVIVTQSPTPINIEPEKLYQLRIELVKAIDSLHGEGINLHEVLLGILHTVNDAAVNA